MKKMHCLLAVGCLLAALFVSPPVSAQMSTPQISPEGDAFAGLTLQGPTKVGEELAQEHASPAYQPLALRRGDSEDSPLAWQVELHMPGASYIAPHFSRFQLPPGSQLIVRAPDGSRSWSYTGHGKGERPQKDGFWGIHIPGETAIVEIYSRRALPAQAVVIDRFAHGDPEVWERAFDIGERAICGADDSDWAKCYQTSEPTMYTKARAVVRLLINGSSACTGWLVGDDGHMMTNEHCIGSSSAALNTDYEFLAEGGTCGTNCASFGACSGIVEATSGTLIQLDAALDYALVKLPSALASTYGYYQIRDTGAVLNERIYIPGHPAAWGKRFAVDSSHSSNSSGFCEVDSTSTTPCSGGPGDVGYYCDTQGGSSGSAVVAYSDHCVVALHHCANCQNRGVPVGAIISDLGSNLPPNALCGDGPVDPTEDPCDNPLYSADFESGSDGWTTSGTCATGTFTSNVPDGVVDTGVTTQVSGGAEGTSRAWFTQRNDASAGVDDVDGGTCATASPTVNASGQSAVEVFLHYFHGQRDAGDDSTDGVEIDVTSNGSLAATLVDEGDITSNAVWTQVSGVINNPGNLQIRARATDGTAGGDLVEAGVDRVFVCPADPVEPPLCVVQDGFEGGASGWSTSGTCSTGAFILGTPDLVIDSGVTTQVGSAHGGSNALFTASNGGGAGTDDVDGGECVLTSPVWTTTATSNLSTWYFHGQRDAGDDPSGDYFRIEMSVNGGAWTAIVAQGDITSNAAWAQATSGSIPAGATVQMRVRASDGAGPGDLVEGGIDDVALCAVP